MTVRVFMSRTNRDQLRNSIRILVCNVNVHALASCRYR